MRPVYSSVLLAGIGSSNYGPVGPGPGQIWVVRDVWWSSGDADGSLVVVYDDAGVILMQDAIPSYELNAPFGHWTGRQVVEGGSSISAYSDASNLSVRISGYELSS
jgi:hypothetical protein